MLVWGNKVVQVLCVQNEVGASLQEHREALKPGLGTLPLLM